MEGANKSNLEIRRVYTRDQVRCGDEDWEKLPGCTNNNELVFLDGTKMPAVPYGKEGSIDFWRDKNGKLAKCHDCGVLPGKFHHPGCDMEQCPKCGEQAISCDDLNDWEGYEKSIVTDPEDL